MSVLSSTIQIQIRIKCLQLSPLRPSVKCRTSCCSPLSVVIGLISRSIQRAFARFMERELHLTQQTECYVSIFAFSLCYWQVMHDEVSETENIRKNLSIERQIVEGCDMLLDVNQIFIRQGTFVSTHAALSLVTIQTGCAAPDTYSGRPNN